MRTFKGHRTLDEVMAQCVTEGIDLDVSRYINDGSDYVVLRAPAITVLYSVFNGRFFGTVPAIPGKQEQIEFNSDEDRSDDWYQRVVEFFYTDEELPK